MTTYEPTEAEIEAAANALCDRTYVASEIDQLTLRARQMIVDDARAALVAAHAVRAEVGRCGDEAPDLMLSRPPETCRLPAGHAGWHRSDSGAEWTWRKPYPECPDHREVQHRDGKPPWCDTCGWSRGRPAIGPEQHGTPRATRTERRD